MASDRNRVVVFDLPFALHVPEGDPSGGSEEFYVAGDPPAGVRLLLKYTQDNAVVAGGVLEGGDPYGRASFTRAQVRFHVPTFPDTEEWTTEELVQAAVDRVNLVIDHYRDVASRPLVRRVSYRHLVRFSIFEERPGEPAQPLIQLYGAGPLRVGVGDEESRVFHELRRRLEQAVPPTFLRLLELDIDARLATGETRAAVFDAGTMFESWLRQSLEAKYASEGLSPSEIEAKFNRGGYPLGIRAIAATRVLDATGYDFAATSAFASWDVDARVLRNRIVHEGLATVTPTQARTAVDAVHAAIADLRANAGLV